MADTLVEMKTKMEERADQVRRYVDEYAALTLEADRIKQRMEWLKGQFETLATGALKDTKLLSISYWGTQNSRVTVTNTATVKPISLTMVKKVLGNVAGDFVKSETVDKMTEPCKRLLAMVCHDGQPGGDHPGHHRRRQDPGDPAEEAEGPLGEGQGPAGEGGRAAGAGGQRLGFPGRRGHQLGMAGAGAGGRRLGGHGAGGH